jgi:hypothetical protein
MAVLSESQLKKEVVQYQSRLMMKMTLSMSMSEFQLMREVAWPRLLMAEMMSVSKLSC